LHKKTSGHEQKQLAQGRKYIRGTTLIAAFNKPPLIRDQTIPARITAGIRTPLLRIFQGIGSGVYLYIRQHPLSPTAVSLIAGAPAY